MNMNKDDLVKADSSKNQSESSHKILEKVKKSMLDDLVKGNCKKIAMGILIRTEINPNAMGLYTFFGDSSDNNNLNAVSGWIYEMSPNQTSCNSSDINEYMSAFIRRLSDNGIYINSL